MLSTRKHPKLTGDNTLITESRTLVQTLEKLPEVTKIKPLPKTRINRIFPDQYTAAVVIIDRSEIHVVIQVTVPTCTQTIRVSAAVTIGVEEAIRQANRRILNRYGL